MIAGRSTKAAAFIACCLMVTFAVAEQGKIRLRQAEPQTGAEAKPAPRGPSESSLSGFDYEAFESRLQSHWFQRKAFLAEGRENDALRQSERIQAFCTEEGIGRLRGLADALIVESKYHRTRGNFTKALEALDLAEQLDPGRSQVRLARSAVVWKSGQGAFPALGALLSGLRAAIAEGFQDFSLVNRVLLSLILGLLGTTLLFSIMMVLRYQIPFRHEVEEWFGVRFRSSIGRPVGYTLLVLPFLTWVGAGWACFYWLIITYRFMRRSERAATVFLLLATFLAVPAYRVAGTVYGITTDPVTRTTMDAATGPYSPERIVDMQKLVNAHPEDATYRFLLAGLYAKGQFFNDAFHEYQMVLEVDPGRYEALINIGNIYYELQNFNEAGAFYLRSLEQQPDSVLALYNLHRSHAEGFRFTASEEALARARNLDSERVTALMAGEEGDGRAEVVPAVIDIGTIWNAAFAGGALHEAGRAKPGPGLAGLLMSQLLNPVSIAALLTLFLAVVLGRLPAEKGPARRCIRCGRPFCHRCKTGREGHEYCSQCLHLFVLGDGLAPDTKTKKMFEVETYEKRMRRVRSGIGWLFPGSSHVLRGRILTGCLFLVAWFTAVLMWQPIALLPVEKLTGFDLRLDLLFSGAVPASPAVNAAAILGLAGTILIWLTAIIGRSKRTET
jgi:tetratricopeptide (TPR) repeat protein